MRLVLALGQHDANFVDAYYGPPAWRAEAEQAKWALPDINKRAAVLEVDLRRLPPVDASTPDAEMARLRRAYLARQLGALRARVAMLQGKRFTFDEESRELYDAVAPHNDEASFQAAIEAIGAKVRGQGDLAPRYAAFKQAFVIPPDRLDAVFTAAIAECRAARSRTSRCRPSESFTVAYVTDKSWSAYNWYQGNYKSLIR